MNSSIDPKQLAAAKREDLRLRVARARRRVVGLTLALFAAVWIGVFTQLAVGDDPGLSSGTASSVASAGTASSPGSSASSGSGSSSSGSSSPSDSSSSSGTAANNSGSALTTRQS